MFKLLKSKKVIVSAIVAILFLAPIFPVNGLLPLQNGPMIIIDSILGFCNISVQGFFVLNCNSTNSTLYITHGSGITVIPYPRTQTLFLNGTGSQGSQGPQGPAGPPSLTFDTLTNVGSGQASIYKGNTSNTNFPFKTISVSGGGLTITNGTSLLTITSTALTQALLSINGNTGSAQTLSGTAGHIKITDSGASHTIDTLFKINNSTCSSGRFSSFDNKTGNFACLGGVGGVNTLNGFQGTINLVPQHGNTTISNNTGTITIGLGIYPVITNGSPQTISKKITANQLFLGGIQNASNYRITNLGLPIRSTDMARENTIGNNTLSPYGNPSNGQILEYQSSNSTAIWATPSWVSTITTPDTFTITQSGATINAINGSSGLAQFTGTDVATVAGKAINSTGTKGGLIHFQNGVWSFSHRLYVNTYNMIEGEGLGTIFQAAKGANTDLIVSSNFEALNATCVALSPIGENCVKNTGVQSVVLQNFVLDGNWNGINQTSGATLTPDNTIGWGIKKFGYNWYMNNIMVTNFASGGVYSNGESSLLQPHSTEDKLINSKIHSNGGNGIKWDNPHDSVFHALTIFLNHGHYGMFTTAGIQASDLHVFANGPKMSIQHADSIATNSSNTGLDGTGWLLDGFSSTVTNSEFETEVKGISVIGPNGKLKGDLWNYRDGTALELNSSNNVISGFFDNNNYGITINGQANYISGRFIQSGINSLVIGNANLLSASNSIYGLFTNQPNGTSFINFANVNDTNNYILGNIGTTNNTAITGNPNSSNLIFIKSSGSGTNFPSQVAILAQSNKFTAPNNFASLINTFEQVRFGSTGNNTDSYTGLLSSDPNGAIDLGNSTKLSDTPYMNFHFGKNASQLYNTRIINDLDHTLSFFGNQSGTIKLMQRLSTTSSDFFNLPMNNTKLGTNENANNFRITNLANPTLSTDALPAGRIGNQAISYNASPSDQQVLTYQGANSTAIWKTISSAGTPTITYPIGLIIYPNSTDNQYYLKKIDNTIITHSSCPENVIQYALNSSAKSTIWQTNGTYTYCSNFKGLLLHDYNQYFLDLNAINIVPNGYNKFWAAPAMAYLTSKCTTGGGFPIGTKCGQHQITVDGGFIDEAGTPQRKWIGIEMNGTLSTSASGIYFNHFQNIVFNNTKSVIRFDGNGTLNNSTYINANTFQNLLAYNYVIGINFNYTGSPKNGGDGFNSNHFLDLEFQSGSMTTNGTLNIKHGNNEFDNVFFWDIPTGAWVGNIASDATKTEIIGGAMTSTTVSPRSWNDDGTGTQIWDKSNPKLSTPNYLISQQAPFSTNLLIQRINSITGSAFASTFGILPASGTTDTFFDIGRTGGLGSNTEFLQIATDPKSVAEMTVTSMAHGSVQLRPINFYMSNHTNYFPVLSLDTNNNIGIKNKEKLWFDGISSNLGFMKSINSTYIQYVNGSGLTTYSNNINMTTFNGTNKNIILGSGITLIGTPTSTTPSFNLGTLSSDPIQPRKGTIWISGSSLKYNDNTNTTQTVRIGSSGVSSLNGTSGAININAHNNGTTISLSGGTYSISTKSVVVLTNGSAQIIAKPINFTSPLNMTSGAKLTLQGGSTQFAPLGLGCTQTTPTVLKGGDLWFDCTNANLLFRTSGGATLTTATLSGSQTLSGIKTFSAANLITGSFSSQVTNSLRLASNSLTIRNPASTFGYAIASSAITTNQTLTLPLTTATKTFQVEFNTNQTGGGNNTSITTPIYVGNPTMITTLDQGKIHIDFGKNGWVSPTTLSTGCAITIYYGLASSVTAPTNGSSTVVGTKAFSAQQIDSSVAGDELSINDGGWVSSLTANSKYWVSALVSNQNGATGSCSIARPATSLEGY